jgi:hypothetical protein
MWVTMLRCPRCGQQAARRSARAGAWEHALSLLFVYPFRCQLCATRFRRVHSRRAPRRTHDRREYDRLMVRVPVTLGGAAGHAAGQTVDLSINGCSIATDAVLAPGTSVELRLRLGQSGDVHVDTATVRSQREGGLGLHFTRIAAAERERLSRYLARFLRPSGLAPRRAGLRPQLVLAAALGLLVIAVVYMIFGLLTPPRLR